jgi:L-ribulose-5-phosphate 3-epimerase
MNRTFDTSAGLTRRTFLGAATAAAAGVALAGTAHSAESAPRVGPLCLFTKPLDAFSLDELCAMAAEAGFTGLDLTVRPGGKVEPARVKEDLPKAVEAARKAGLIVPMMVSALTDASEATAASVLDAAATAGVKTYRLGYFKYDEAAPIRGQFEGFRARLRGLAEMNRARGLHGAYQNHAGRGVGAAVWDLAEILRDLDPQCIGCQYDIRHATVEGAQSWPVGLRLIAPHVHCLAIKDFRWTKRGDKWAVEDVPLGEGMVEFPAFFRLVKELGLAGPVTLHVEYPILVDDEKSLSVPEQRKRIVARLAHDRAHLQAALAAAGFA